MNPQRPLTPRTVIQCERSVHELFWGEVAPDGHGACALLPCWQLSAQLPSPGD